MENENNLLYSHLSPTTNYEVPLESSLSRLSSSLENTVLGSKYDFSDAEIEVEGITIGVDRCILAARCPFFHELFRNGNGGSVNEGKPKYLVSELVPHWSIGYEAFMVVLHYLYTGKVKESPVEVSTCVDGSCDHDACLPAIHYAVEMMYASATFRIEELVMVFECRLRSLVNKVSVIDIIPIVKLAYHFQLKRLFSHCVKTIARIDVDDVVIEKELPHEVVSCIKSLRTESNHEGEQDSAQVNYFDYMNTRTIRRILRALDMDDVELVKLLLEESNISLDACFALHYAAAVCDLKTFDKVLKLGVADINLKCPQGTTVLHIAASRKNPSIILRLLERYASVLDRTTTKGWTAVTLLRRSTRPKDLKDSMKHGSKETNMVQLCIDVLEREMCRDPLTQNVSMLSMMKACDLYSKLLLLENRVAMARFMFPVEARLAMYIADADSTSEFIGLSESKGSYGNLREANFNKLPSTQVKRIQQRLQALQKAVEASDRFFPNCSKVLDRFMEDETLGDMLLEKGSPEEQRMKRMRYMELQADVMNAFNKEVTQHIRSGFSSSSPCSSSPKGPHSQLFSIRLRHCDEMPMLELGGMGKEQHGVNHFRCSNEGVNYCKNTFPLETGLDAMNSNGNRISGTYVEHENLETKLNPSETAPEIDEPVHFMGGFDDMTDDVRGKAHEPDPEQSTSSDSDFEDEFVDSDCEICDENDLFDSNIDNDAGVRGSEVPRAEKRTAERGRTEIGNLILEMDECKLELGMKFPDTMSFKDAVKSILLDTVGMSNLHSIISSKSKPSVSMKSVLGLFTHRRFRMRTLLWLKHMLEHISALGHKKVSHATPKFLAKIYNDRIKSDPKWPMESMISIIQKDIKLVVNKWQMYRTKKIVNQSGSASNILPGRLKKHDTKRDKDEENEGAEERGKGKNVVLTKMPRKGLTMTCKTCHKPNHNSRACPLKKDNPSISPTSEALAANQRNETQSKKGSKQSDKGKKVMKKQYKSAVVRRNSQVTRNNNISTQHSLTTDHVNEFPHLPDKPKKRTKYSPSSNVADVSKSSTKDVKFSITKGQSSNMQTRGADEEAPILGSNYLALDD